MSVEPFNKLVKLVARAFYDDKNMKGDNQQKTGRSDNRGMAVVVLDALTRRQWVREEDLAKDLKLHAKQLRRTLRFFEEEKLITRDHRKETAKGAKIFSAAIAATGAGQTGKEEEKLKLHTHSYCCLDYAQIYDVVRYRLYRMKKKIKDELGDKHTIQEYVCPKCQRRYTAFDAVRLVSPMDDCFRCENCNEELIADSEKFAAEETGDKDDAATRRRRRQKLEDMLEKMEVQLKPMIDQLNIVKALTVPEFGTLQAWEARANFAGRLRNGDSNSNDSSRASQGQGYGGMQMPYVGETMVEVALPGTEVKEEDIKPDAGTMKVLPPWMIKQGMQLTNEQRGGVRQELNMGNGSGSADLSDDKKSVFDAKEDEKTLKDEYVKAYYAALLQRQQEQDAKAKQQESAMADTISDYRHVGMKSKREEDEGDDDVEWEEEAPNTGNTSEHHKVHDLNLEADAIEDGEDDIDWEEG